MNRVEAFSQHLASLVIKHRKAGKLTQLQLAQYAGVGKTVIFDIEHGKSSVRLDTLLKVLHVLNINVSLTSPLVENE